jgi:transcription-repair coupling factor (superfamily II helicase)
LKINIYDDKAEITLNEKNGIDASKIINLIQTQPTQYQLKNQNTIVINEYMEPDMSRISKISKLLSTIA